MPLESLGWFMVGAGAVLLVIATVGVGRLFARGMRLRKNRKFARYLAEIEDAAKEFLDRNKEISEFNFRDTDGKWAKVRIVIDHDMRDRINATTGEVEELIERGDAGTLDQLMSNHRIISGPMSQVQEFIFSAKAVDSMRESGLEPDDVVIRMLKASGRML